jgi:hypothetical protein
VALTPHNLAPAVLASCSIPFWLTRCTTCPARRGAYWDGGITDYHLHLAYAGMADGLVLYPHFQSQVVPGWLDKPGSAATAPARAGQRGAAVAAPDWVRTLPGGKLPDRGDFKAYGDDIAGRIATGARALAESQRLADEFAELGGRRTPMPPKPCRCRLSLRGWLG